LHHKYSGEGKQQRVLICFLYLTAALLQGKTECSNIVGGLQNITNYFARHTPTFRDYALRDVKLTFYVSTNCILILACLATALFLSCLAFLPLC
jgi:hypothetical protein